MPVVVTGAHGFLGRALVEQLAASPRVTSLGRHSGDDPWSLSDTLAPDLSGHSAVIHCAWAISPRTQATAQLNVAGSLALLNAAMRADIPFAFVSSMSASDGTRSRYGQSKRVVENHVMSYPRGLVIRPGTIRDDSGGIGMLGDSLSRLASLPVEALISPDPFVPVVDRRRVVSSIVEHLLDHETSSVEVDLVDEWIPLSDLMKSLAPTRKSRPRVKVPAGLVTTTCSVAQQVSLPPLRDLADSWLGLMDASNRRPRRGP